MYVSKAKRNIELQDLCEQQEKRERFLERQAQHTMVGVSVSPEQPADGGDGFVPEELPDGFCISPHRVVRSPSTGKEDNAVRPAQYIGSFSVIGEDQTARAEYVRDQLAGMREVNKSKPVLLVISLSGIKVCSSNGQSVYMAHALKRISYATCDPEFCQFSFLAREPKGQTNMQYCHAFVTKSSQEAEELNTIVGNAFKMAYASQAHKQPTFNELIEQQIEAHKAKVQEVQEQKQQQLQKQLSQISTATVAERVKERKELRRVQQELFEHEKEANRIVGKEKLWAKQAVPKTKHKPPFSDKQEEAGGSQIIRHSADMSYHQRSSYHNHVTAIKEAVDSGNIRSYGSPVMSLKETIDEHFKNGHTITYDYRRSAPPETYIRQSSEIRVVSQGHGHSGHPHDRSSVHSQQPAKTHDIQSRPLPTTPSTSQQNGSPSSRKSQGHSHRSPPREQRQERSPQGQRVEGHREGHRSDSHRDSHRSEGHRSEGHRSERSEVHKADSPHPQESASKGHVKNGRHEKSTHSRYQNSSPVRQSETEQVEDLPDDTYEGQGSPKYDSMHRLDNSDIEDEDLRHASWYQPGIPREIALEILSQEEIGSFVVRDSTSRPGCYALSVKVPKFIQNQSGICHYLILRTQRGGVKLKGLDKEWPSLTALVTHHTVMHELLPCTLRLPRNAKNPIYKDSEQKEKEEDEDYQKLTDCSQMMQDLSSS